MIRPTVLHPGFINEAVEAVAETPRWADAVARLGDWGLPEEARRAARDELREMELGAWAAAGKKYRRALQAYEVHASWERMMRGEQLRVGWMGRKTAIDYQDPPKPPISIDFRWHG